MLIYQLLDYFLLLFHALVTLFNMFGWVFKATRKINLVTLLLTGGSWFVVGAFKGWGYCPLTEWHWQVLAKLGEKELPASYIRYTIQRWFQVDVDPWLIEQVTLWSFFFVLSVSIYLNLRNYLNRDSAFGRRGGVGSR